MDNGTYKKPTEEASRLAQNAIAEWRLCRSVSVICPKCGEKPQVTTLGNDERTIVRCGCGYISEMEIYL